MQMLFYTVTILEAEVQDVPEFVQGHVNNLW